MHSRLSEILFVSLSFSLFSAFSQEHNKASSQMYQARVLNLANAVSSCRLCDSPLPPGANLLPWHCNRGLRPAALPRPHSCSLPSHVLGALAKQSCKPTATNTAGQSYDRQAPQKTMPLWLFQSHVGPFYPWIN